MHPGGGAPPEAYQLPAAPGRASEAPPVIPRHANLVPTGGFAQLAGMYAPRPDKPAPKRAFPILRWVTAVILSLSAVSLVLLWVIAFARRDDLAYQQERTLQRLSEIVARAGATLWLAGRVSISVWGHVTIRRAARRYPFKQFRPSAATGFIAPVAALMVMNWLIRRIDACTSVYGGTYCGGSVEADGWLVLFAFVALLGIGAVLPFWALKKASRCEDGITAPGLRGWHATALIEFLLVLTWIILVFVTLIRGVTVVSAVVVASMVIIASLNYVVGVVCAVIGMSNTDWATSGYSSLEQTLAPAQTKPVESPWVTT